jgi:hypothetical protein
MKPIQLITAIVIAIFSALNLQAQKDIPKGFQRGSIQLLDSSTRTGYIKEYFSRDASIIVLQDDDQKKTRYTASDLLSLQMDRSKFICFKGDFFHVVSAGEISLLQKVSNVSAKPAYNGSEAFFVSGSEGQQGDYFIYHPKDKQLLLVHRKNKDLIISLFNNDSAATDLAKQSITNTDRLKDAVEVYNSRTTR